MRGLVLTTLALSFGTSAFAATLGVGQGFDLDMNAPRVAPLEPQEFRVLPEFKNNGAKPSICLTDLMASNEPCEKDMLNGAENPSDLGQS